MQNVTINERTLKYYRERLKEFDLSTYKMMKNKMSDPLLLVNTLIRHYQWILQHGDIQNLDLSTANNYANFDLFVFAITSSKDFADEFYNYFVNSIRTAYNPYSKKWSKELISDILVNGKRLYVFDLSAMYILIAATINNLSEYVSNLSVNPKVNIPLNDIIEMFTMIIDQDFYDNLKKDIIARREIVNLSKYHY